jgi:glycosyltransferase involved in cell wall biosynthesis
MISVVIPAHNEAGVISRTIAGLAEAIEFDFEIIVVDDYSTDNTAQIVDTLAKGDRRIRLLKNNQKPGFGNAIKAGFENASGETIVCVMADLCDNPYTINQMYDRIKQGYDVVCGSRYTKGGRKIGGPFLKTLFSRFFGFSLNKIIKIPTLDVANSFKMYRKKVIESLDIESKDFEVSVEMILKAYFKGYRITEVATTWYDRKAGKSKFKAFRVGPAYLRLYLGAINQKRKQNRAALF